MDTRTEILKLSWNETDRWPVNNLTGFYWGIFKKWWDHFGLKGDGIVVGEEGKYAEEVIRKLKKEYPKIKTIESASLEGATLCWDITEPLDLDTFPLQDFIICQAVLEHVIDPVSAIRNLTDIIKRDGRLFLHSHGPRFKEHRYPVDCYRYMRDALIGWSELLGLEIEDILWTPKHWFVVYKV